MGGMLRAATPADAQQPRPVAPDTTALGLRATPTATSATTGTAGASSLSLTDALREADHRAFPNRLKSADIDGDRAQVRRAMQGLLPSARVETGIVRTTDPIGAFGTLLRQRQVTPAAFDPARLNNPRAITNVQSGVVVDLPLLNLDAWTGLGAAKAAADAGRANGEWTARTTRLAVVRAYFGATLANEQITTLEQSQRAADAALRQVQSMVEQGIVTKADALQASVRAARVHSELIAARSDAITAEQQLALLLGRVPGIVPVVPDTLPDDAPLRALAVSDTLPVNDMRSRDDGPLWPQRSDLRAADAGLLAADADRRRALGSMLPRVNGFARYDWNTPTAAFGGQKNWTVGLIASWFLYNGGALADVAAAAAKAATARIRSETAYAQAQLEGDATRRGVIVALQRLDLATLTAAQSREAHRLVDKRYAGGLATIAELLSADASATEAALARSAARFTVISAVAAHRLATGSDPASLATIGGTP